MGGVNFVAGPVQAPAANPPVVQQDLSLPGQAAPGAAVVGPAPAAGDVAAVQAQPIQAAAAGVDLAEVKLPEEFLKAADKNAQKQAATQGASAQSPIQAPTQATSEAAPPPAAAPGAAPSTPGHIRYMHPSNRALTWDGQGSMPDWIHAWLTTGGTLYALEIAAEKLAPRPIPGSFRTD